MAFIQCEKNVERKDKRALMTMEPEDISIDHFINKKLENAEVQFNLDHWEQLNAQLNPPSSPNTGDGGASISQVAGLSKLYITALIAVPTVIVLSLAVWYYATWNEKVSSEPRVAPKVGESVPKEGAASEFKLETGGTKKESPVLEESRDVTPESVEGATLPVQVESSVESEIMSELPKAIVDTMAKDSILKAKKDTSKKNLRIFW